MQRLAPLAIGLALALHVGVEAARADFDAGASTFESAARRYRHRPIDESKIPVPAVQPKAQQNLPSVPDYGPGDQTLRFPIRRFEVTGATLLSPSTIDSTLAPYTGTGKRIQDVQEARNALQKAYEKEGLLTVAVTIPQQTIESGVVRLEVVEARLGKVTVENEGVKWFSDQSVRRLTPDLQPGVVLRRDELQQDLEQVNRNPDRQVTPVLEKGEEPATVDLALKVDDRIPLHGSLEINNDHTPGSPRYRAVTMLSYGNLWGLEHEATVSYQFAPDGFHEVQIESGSYRAPMPWSEKQQLFFYVVNSNSSNTVVTAPGIGLTGKGLNGGLRYIASLPQLPGIEAYTHGVTLGVDRKKIENFTTAGTESIKTPITYLPFDLQYAGNLLLDQSLTSASVEFDFNRAGLVHGGSSEDFFINRPAKGVDGNYEIWKFGLQHTLRLSALLKTLARSRFVDLSKPENPFPRDWTLYVDARGQYATQPLISSEQCSGGGVDSVRGYLDGEIFGDQCWNAQFELRTPYFSGWLGGYLDEQIQLVAFYDAAQMITLQPGKDQPRKQDLQGFGLGFRASLFRHLSAEVFAGYPRDSTVNSHDHIRYHFRVNAGF